VDREDVMAKTRRQLKRELDETYKMIGNILRMAKQQVLDAKRSDIAWKVERILTIVNHDRQYREGIKKLDRDGYEEYERIVKGLLGQILNGNWRGFSEINGLRWMPTIGVREEPQFRAGRPVHEEPLQMTIEKSREIDMALRNKNYADGRPSPPAYSNAISRIQLKSFVLEKNLLLRIVASLPYGNPNDPFQGSVPGLSPNDYDDIGYPSALTGGGNRVPTPAVYTINGFNFIGGVILEFFKTSDGGGHFGDVIFTYTLNNQGIVIDWNIKMVSFGNGQKLYNYIMTQKSAFAYLDENREKLIREGSYAKLQKILSR
jgi:hypothetical protein